MMHDCEKSHSAIVAAKPRHRKSRRDRMRAKLKEVKKELRRRMHRKRFSDPTALTA